jgi:SAM-dependent methyltransferase
VNHSGISKVLWIKSSVSRTWAKPFGYEYAYRPGWGGLQRGFIAVFGIVDLPTRIRARAVLWALRRSHCDRALDVGTGTGVYALYITRDAKHQCVAMDIDRNRIESIRAMADKLGRQGLSTVCGNERVLASLPADFSAVLALEVLQYFPDLREIMLLLQRRLQPGGVLIIHFPVMDRLRPYEHHLLDDIVIRKLCMEAGLEIAEIRQTFGWFAQVLCAVFAWCVPRQWALAIIYPLLLSLISLMPRFTRNGAFRLVIARKPFVGIPRQ